MMPVIRYLKDSHGHRVAYAVHGEGPVLVCPAWWISHVEKDWDFPWFRDFFTRLGERFRVVRYDRPGVGLSDRDVPPRSLEAEVELLTTIIDTLTGFEEAPSGLREAFSGHPKATRSSEEKASLFAISCGSPIALTYAAQHPDRLDRICCYGAFLDGADIASEPVQKVMIELVLTHWGMGSRALADLFLPNQNREELDALSKQQRDSTSAERAAELLQLTYTMDATPVLPKLTTDMLVIHRKGDRAIPSAAGRRLAASVPGTPFVSLNGRAHPPWIEGDEVLRGVIEFLARRPVSFDSNVTANRVASPCRLDAPNRELITGDQAIPLTPLEFGVMHHLIDASGRVVTRDELLEHIWHSPFAGSNKVEAVIRTLRKKLGAYSRSIETVRGHGYRFREWR